MTTEIHHFVGGRQVPGRSERKANVYNPATGEVTGLVSLATTEEVAAVITFLSSEDSAYLTGTTVDINGGSHMH